MKGVIDDMKHQDLFDEYMESFASKEEQAIRRKEIRQRDDIHGEEYEITFRLDGTILLTGMESGNSTIMSGEDYVNADRWEYTGYRSEIRVNGEWHPYHFENDVIRGDIGGLQPGVISVGGGGGGGSYDVTISTDNRMIRSIDGALLQNVETTAPHIFSYEVTPLITSNNHMQVNADGTIITYNSNGEEVIRIDEHGIRFGGDIIVPATRPARSVHGDNNSTSS
jgi:hypothetical protein